MPVPFHASRLPAANRQLFAVKVTGSLAFSRFDVALAMEPEPSPP